MNFTVEVRSGLCNTLKSFVTALSIGKANVLPNHTIHFDADHSEIFDSSLICKSPAEFGVSFITARFLILASEEDEQSDLINDAKSLGDHPNIANKQLAPFFSKRTIDWFYDRSLICDKVYKRIQRGIEKVKWRPEVLSEVERVSKEFEGSVLGVQVRTWTHQSDPPNCTSIRDGVERDYKRAYNLFLQAAQKGHPESSRYLGLMFLSGKGVTKNIKSSTEWFEKAAAGGDDMGRRSLERLRMLRAE